MIKYLKILFNNSLNKDMKNHLVAIYYYVNPVEYVLEVKYYTYDDILLKNGFHCIHCNIEEYIIHKYIKIMFLMCIS